MALKRIWLVGGSEGIGYELLRLLLEQGHQVVVSSRKAEQQTKLGILQNQFSGQLERLNLDVTLTEDIPTKVNEAWHFFNGLDVWIYNAGAYQPMRVEEWQLDKFVEMQSINYLGAVHLAVPLSRLFKKQGQGTWLWNVSLASDFGLPYGGAYSAPKAALMNLAESLQPELAQQNLKLKVVNHGFVKTRLTEKNDFPMLGLMSADQAAKKILKALESSAFESRFPWNLSLVLAVIKRLPKSWALGITKHLLK